MSLPFPAVKYDEEGNAFVCPKCVAVWVAIFAGIAIAWFLYRRYRK